MERYIRVFLLGIFVMFGLINNAKAASRMYIVPIASTDFTSIDDYLGSGVAHNTACSGDNYTGYAGHEGMDFVLNVGTPVYAAASGTVHTDDDENDYKELCATTAQNCYGYYLGIDHGNGNWTLYAHLDSYAVADGVYVEQGELIAYSGQSGPTYPHLHWEVLTGVGSNPVNGNPHNPYYCDNEWFTTSPPTYADPIPTDAYDAITAKADELWALDFIQYEPDGGDMHWYVGASDPYIIEDWTGGNWGDVALTFDPDNVDQTEAYVLRHDFWTTYQNYGPDYMGPPLGDEMDVTRIGEYDAYDPYCTPQYGVDHPSPCIREYCGSTLFFSSVQRFANGPMLCYWRGYSSSTSDDYTCEAGVDCPTIFLWSGSTDDDQDNDTWTTEEGDCNDNSNGQYPNHPELDDDRDNDCDGLVDDDGIELTSIVAADLADTDARPSCRASNTTIAVVFSTNGGRIQEFSFNGDDWSSLDLSAQASVPFASSGTSPYLFTHPYTAEQFVIFTGDNARINLLRSNTGTWTSVDLTSQAAVDYADQDSSPSGVISPNTQYLYVVFSTTGGRIQQFTYNGTSWTSLDLSAQAPVPYASLGTSPHLFLHPYTGERFVVFTGEDARINLLRSNSGTWTSVDLTSQAAVDYADLNGSPFGYIDPFTEYLHVIFTTNGGRIQEFTYNGNTWSSLDLTSQAAVQLAAPGSSPIAFVDNWTEERVVQFLGEDSRMQELVWNGFSWSSRDLTSLIPIEYSATGATPAPCFDTYTGDRTTVFTGTNARIELITYQGE